MNIYWSPIRETPRQLRAAASLQDPTDSACAGCLAITAWAWIRETASSDFGMSTSARSTEKREPEPHTRKAALQGLVGEPERFGRGAQAAERGVGDDRVGDLS